MHLSSSPPTHHPPYVCQQNRAHCTASTTRAWLVSTSNYSCACVWLIASSFQCALVITERHATPLLHVLHVVSTTHIHKQFVAQGAPSSLNSNTQHAAGGRGAAKAIMAPRDSFGQPRERKGEGAASTRAAPCHGGSSGVMGSCRVAREGRCPHYGIASDTHSNRLTRYTISGLMTSTVAAKGVEAMTRRKVDEEEGQPVPAAKE